MLDIEQWVQQRDSAAAEDAVSRWGSVQELVPDHTLVVVKTRHKHEDIVRLPGQLYWMHNERIAANVERGLVTTIRETPCNFWEPKGRLLGVEDMGNAKPKVKRPHTGSLAILQGCGYDPGSAAFRLHSAINEHTKHASVFVRWADTNPHCSLRQYDGEKDIGLVRDAFMQADVLHCHVGYLLVNNLGMKPMDHQILVRHYHGSEPNGGTHMEPIFDRLKGAKLFGARLSLVEEGKRFDLDVEWSPIPMAVQRYQKLRDKSRASAKWTPLTGKASIKRPLIVGHSPTNMAIKGTDVLRKTVDALRARGVPVELKLIHGVSLREALEQKALCDVVFDSFWLGIQGSGLESGAMEIPVIAGDSDVQFLYTQEIGHVPYTFADTQRELTNVLEQMAMDPEFRERETVMVSSYVNNVHDYKAVAARYERSLAKWLGRDDVITEAW